MVLHQKHNYGIKSLDSLLIWSTKQVLPGNCLNLELNSVRLLTGYQAINYAIKVKSDEARETPNMWHVSSTESNYLPSLNLATDFDGRNSPLITSGEAKENSNTWGRKNAKATGRSVFTSNILMIIIPKLDQVQTDV